MGYFYTYKDGYLVTRGCCADGQEELQPLGEGEQLGLGEPPEGMTWPPEPEPDYRDKRRAKYPKYGDQLDMLWHAMDDGIIPKIEPLYSEIKAVKERYPKPEPLA